MPKFKLLPGAAHHSGGFGEKTYAAGDIIDSPHELDKLFVNKFERVHGKTSKGDSEDLEAVEMNRLNGPRFSRAVDPKDTTPAKGSEMKAFEATEDERNAALTKAAGGEDEGDEEEAPAKKKPGRKKKPAKKAEPKSDEGGDDSGGEDVTDQFESAGDAKLTVTKTEEGHVVKQGNKTLTDKPLRTKKQVESFIDKFNESEDED